MFLHWLVNVFPVEMREGWNLVRPDLLVWTAVASLTVLSPFLVGTTAGVQTSAAGLVLSQVAGLVIVVVQAVRFDQHAEGGGVWSEALSHAVVRMLPAAFYATLAVLVASGATALVRQALGQLLQGTPVAPIAVAGVSAVILVSLLAMFAFVPFFAATSARTELSAEKLAKTTWLRPLASALWPLAASRKTTDGRRWRIAPYVVLMVAAPFPAIFAPPIVQLPLTVVLLLVSWTAVAVIFLQYREARTEVMA